VGGVAQAESETVATSASAAGSRSNFVAMLGITVDFPLLRTNASAPASPAQLNTSQRSAACRRAHSNPAIPKPVGMPPSERSPARLITLVPVQFRSIGASVLP